MSGPPLVTVAHGSRDPRSAACVQAILDRVREARPMISVVPAWLDFERPTLAEALGALDHEAVVVPLLLTSGYHTNVDIPRTLKSVPPDLRVRYAPPLGPHPLLVEAVCRRLAEAGAPQRGPVVLAWAGSSWRGAAAEIDRVAAALAARLGRPVVPASSSGGAPQVAAALDRVRRESAHLVAVASYLLAPGRLHDQVRRAAGPDSVVAEPLGDLPEVAQVILDRYDEAAPVSDRTS